MEFAGSANCTSDYLAALGYAIDAIEKQIPKKIVKTMKHEGLCSFMSGECPTCGYNVGNFKDYNYCNRCGQRLEFDAADAVCLCDEKGERTEMTQRRAYCITCKYLFRRGCEDRKCEDCENRDVKGCRCFQVDPYAEECPYYVEADDD